MFSVGKLKKNNPSIYTLKYQCNSGWVTHLIELPFFHSDVFKENCTCDNMLDF